MFRCPNCGQGKKISFNGKKMHNIKMVMTDTMDKPESFIWLGTHNEGDEIYDDFKTFFVEAVDDEQASQCEQCLIVNPIKEWKEAYKEPLKYFEMENAQLCHCGGELWMDRIPNTNNYGFVCEKCEWVKPNKKVSGA